MSTERGIVTKVAGAPTPTALRAYRSMTANDSAADKSIVNQLGFSARTSKRVTWEQLEFSVESPYLVRVTNASYGYLKDDHSYKVGVADRGGQLIPAECDCPADLHYDAGCKHKVALALCGGPVVMQAAADYQALGGERSAAGGTHGRRQASCGWGRQPPLCEETGGV